MDLQEVIKIAQNKFQTQIDPSYLENENLKIFKAEFQNNYVLINELRDADYYEISFFKSDRKYEHIYDDQLYFGVTFYPKTLEAVKCIFETIDR